MQSDSLRWRRASLLVGATLLLAACGHRHFGTDDADDSGINVYPTSYKSDILGGMHAYLNDPTGIRDAAISEPILKPVGNSTVYVVCVQFNGKLNGNTNTGDKVFAAVFLAGHFDHFVEKSQDICGGVALVPFPELEKLPR